MSHHHTVVRNDHHHCIGPPCDICGPDPRDAEIAALKAEVELVKRESVALAAALHEHEERHGVEKLITGHIEAATINQRHEVGMLLADIARLKAELEAERFDTRILRRNLDQARDDHDAEAARLRAALAAGPAALRAKAPRLTWPWSTPGSAYESAAVEVEAAQAAAMKEGDHG